VPIFTPDGKNVTFQSMRRGPFEIFTVAADGSGEAQLLFELPTGEAWPTDWSPDGSLLLFARWPAETDNDILGYAPADGSVAPVIATRFSDTSARISPDGRWVAYQTEVDDVVEVFLTTLEPGGPRVRVSVGGGGGPRWSPDGKSLYFWIMEDLHRVDLSFAPEVIVSAPTLVIPKRQHGGFVEDYDIHPDGQRFVAVVNPPVDDAIKLVFNWFAELERLVPVAD
jgi:Tol biopolymer transport system component